MAIEQQAKFEPEVLIFILYCKGNGLSTCSLNKVAILSHAEVKCGIFQYGYRLNRVLQGSQRFQFEFVPVKNENDLFKLRLEDYTCLIFNYSPGTMAWLSADVLQKIKPPKLCLVHVDKPNLKFDAFIHLDPTLKEENETEYSLPRPIFENVTLEKS